VYSSTNKYRHHQPRNFKLGNGSEKINYTVSTPPSTYFKNKKLARPLSKIIINYDKRRPDERTL
jgi:hypothetical protein